MSKTKIDLWTLRDELESAINWSYVESEGPDCVRFDSSTDSMWVYENGSISGMKPTAKIQKIINDCIIEEN